MFYFMNYTGDLGYDMTVFIAKKKFAENCSDELLSIVKNADLFACRYIFPVFFVFGMVGNSLNLLVLNSMRGDGNVSHQLFAGIAMADIGLLLVMAFNVLGAWPIFYRNNSIRIIYYTGHMLMIFLENVFLSISSWLVTCLSFERMYSIFSPLKTHIRYRWRFHGMLICIVLFSILLCSFHLVEYKYGYGNVCNGTTIFGLHHSIYAMYEKFHISPWLLNFVIVGKVSQITFCVFVPLFLISFFHLAMVVKLRRRRTPSEVVAHRTSSIETTKGSSEPRQQRDQKITVLVGTIISFYLITHLPSTLPFILEIANFAWPSWFKSFGNTVVIYWLLCGKVFNFVLFFLTSKNFRDRLFHFYLPHINAMRARFGRAPLGKKYSTMSSKTYVQLLSKKQSEQTVGSIVEEVKEQSSMRA